jgi:hypothetical protein
MSHKKIFTGLVTATVYFLDTHNAAAAIAIVTTPVSVESNDRTYLNFDGTTLAIGSNNIGYKLQMRLQRDEMGDVIFLTKHNDTFGYSGDGFTFAIAETVISSALAYNGDLFTSAPYHVSSFYYGFKYGTGSGGSIQYHYGWVNLTVDLSGGTFTSPYSRGTLTVNSAAINTISGESILAGQTAVTAVPEPGMWVPSSLLVCGGVYVRFIRRHRAPRSRGKSR